MKWLLPYLVPLLLLISCSSEEATVPQLSEWHEVGKLELVEYRTEEIFVISPQSKQLSSIKSIGELSQYLADQLTVGDRVGVYSFDNYSIAYIDLTQLREEDIQYTPSSKSIQVTLPAIEIEPIGRGGHIRQLHKRVSGLQSDITSEERRQMQNKASALAIEALAPGTPKHKALVEQAEQKARVYFTGMLHTRGCEEVIIKFR